MSTTTSPFLSYSNAFAAYANGTNAASMRLCAAMYTEPALNHEAVRSLHTVSYHFFELHRQALPLIAQLDQASAWDTALNREYVGSEYADVLSSCRRECLTKRTLLTAARAEVLALVPHVAGTAAQAVGQVLDLIDDMQYRLASVGGDHER